MHCVYLQACLVAVVIPDPDFLSGWTKRTLGLDGSYQELCSKAVIVYTVLLHFMMELPAYIVSCESISLSENTLNRFARTMTN